jgi:hypothetical protein
VPTELRIERSRYAELRSTRGPAWSNRERDGRTLTESRVLFCRVENERIAEVWIYAFDLYALDDFWG